MSFALEAEELPFNHDQRRAAKKLRWKHVGRRVRELKMPYRDLWLVEALAQYQSAHRGKPVLFIGNKSLAKRTRHSLSSVKRAKADCDRLEVVLLTTTKGGMARDEQGHVKRDPRTSMAIRSATGYQPHPLLVLDLHLADVKKERAPAAAGDEPSPAAAMAARIRELIKQRDARAGP